MKTTRLIDVDSKSRQAWRISTTSHIQTAPPTSHTPSQGMPQEILLSLYRWRLRMSKIQICPASVYEFKSELGKQTNKQTKYLTFIKVVFAKTTLVKQFGFNKTLLLCQAVKHPGKQVFKGRWYENIFKCCQVLRTEPREETVFSNSKVLWSYNPR